MQFSIIVWITITIIIISLLIAHNLQIYATLRVITN